MRYKQLTREIHNLFWFVDANEPEDEVPPRGRVAIYLEAILQSIRGPESKKWRVNSKKQFDS